MHLTIRRGKLSDLPTIVGYNTAMAWETEHLNLNRDVLREGVAGVMEEPSRGFYLLAEIEGRVVGQTMITFEWTDWRNGTFWWIQSVYVHPAYRRRGIYRAIYRHVLDQAREAGGVRGLRLYVARGNTDAQKVYSRLGMKKAVYEMYEIDFLAPPVDSGGLGRSETEGSSS